MRNQHDDRRIQRFMAWGGLILLTPWLLIGALKAAESMAGGVLDNGALQAGLIGTIGLIFGVLVVWMMPTPKSRQGVRVSEDSRSR